MESEEVLELMSLFHWFFSEVVMTTSLNGPFHVNNVSLDIMMLMGVHSSISVHQFNVQN